MKKSLILTAAILAGTAFLAAETKVGIINPQAVLQASVKGKEVIVKLQELEQAKGKQYDALQKAIETLTKDAANPALNQDTRDKKAAELQNKQIELKRFTEDAQKDLTAVRQKEFDAMQKDLMPIIEKISKDGGFSLVLDLTTAGIAYADPTVDITEAVIKAYDAKYSTPAAKPAK
jgi:outer membrane protein